LSRSESGTRSKPYSYHLSYG